MRNTSKGVMGSFQCFVFWSTMSIFLLNVAGPYFNLSEQIFMDLLRCRELLVLYEDGHTKHCLATSRVIPSRFYSILLQVGYGHPLSNFNFNEKKISSLLGDRYIKSSSNSFLWDRAHVPSSHSNLHL